MIALSSGVIAYSLRFGTRSKAEDSYRVKSAVQILGIGCVNATGELRPSRADSAQHDKSTTSLERERDDPARPRESRKAMAGPARPRGMGSSGVLGERSRNGGRMLRGCRRYDLEVEYIRPGRGLSE